MQDDILGKLENYEQRIMSNEYLHLNFNDS